MPIRNESYISTDNSSTATLADAATYTGTWEDVSRYSSIVVGVFADQDGILYIDFSPDATNADTTFTSYYNTTDTETPKRFTIKSKYFRIRFTNDSGSSQTAFRLQTSVKANSELIDIPVDTHCSRGADAIVTRPTEYKEEVALGLRGGITTWNKFGYNSDVDTGSEEVIASFGGTFNIMTSGDTLDVVSASANDTAAGTGARTILITGIDGNSLPQTEIVTLNGTTAVTTVNSWLGVNRALVLSSGSGNTNAGVITIDDTSGTVGTQAEIPNGGDSSVTQQCIFHTPVNHTLTATWLWFNALKLSGGGGSPRVFVRGYSYSRVTSTVYEVFRGNIDTSVENTVELNPSEPFVIGGNEVLYFTATTDVNNTEITARFSGKLTKGADAE